MRAHGCGGCLPRIIVCVLAAGFIWQLFGADFEPYVKKAERLAYPDDMTRTRRPGRAFRWS